MNIFHPLLICLLAMSLPLQGLASAAMAHCKGSAGAANVEVSQLPAHHDHTAMMAGMAAAATDEMAAMAGIGHTEASGTAQVATQVFKFGCNCGCTCGGDCAISCAAMVVGLTDSLASITLHILNLVSVAPDGQAHAAYRYQPLRPPSAVAL